MNKHKQRGFTIVELLIVIVVVAILAAVTVVAYNGIQNRSRLAKDGQDLAVLTKAIQLYIANGGSMRDRVAGANSGSGCGGYWFGSGDSLYSCSKTMRQALKDSGYLPQSFNRDFMLAFCNTSGGAGADGKRAVLIKSEVAPPNTPSEQIAPDTCGDNTFNGYTANQYNMNLAKIVEG